MTDRLDYTGLVPSAEEILDAVLAPGGNGTWVDVPEDEQDQALRVAILAVLLKINDTLDQLVGRDAEKAVDTQQGWVVLDYQEPL